MGDFREVRRQDRLLDEQRAQELLETAEYGFLCAGTDGNGYAYGVPINFAYDCAAGELYFHCAPEGQKLEAMRRNGGKVTFCVVGRTQPLSDKFTTLYESVMVFGTVNLVPSDDEKRLALRRLVRKYSAGYAATGEIYMEKSFHRTLTFTVKVEHITAKAKK